MQHGPEPLVLVQDAEQDLWGARRFLTVDGDVEALRSDAEPQWNAVQLERDSVSWPTLMTRPDDALATQLVELSRVLTTKDGLDLTLERVATLSTSLVESCDGCGVSLLRNGSVSTRAASDDRADRVDELQYREGEGPCLHAMTTGEPVSVPSFEAEARWPGFIDRAIDEGIKASYSVPLRVDTDIVGSLNLYSSNADFGAEDRRVADMLAGQAAVALKNAQTLKDVLDLVEQLQGALESRDLIGRAKGMLMARHGLTDHEAFQRLRRESQNRNIKLRTIALDVVELRLDLASPPLGDGPG